MRLFMFKHRTICQCYEKKRRVIGEQNVEIEKMLESSSAAKMQSKLVKKIMKPGDIEPAHLPSKNSEA